MTDLNPSRGSRHTVHPGSNQGPDQEAESSDPAHCLDSANFKTFTESRPNGDLVLVVESPRYGVCRRVVPKDLKDPAEFINRVKLDLLIQNGELPCSEILKAARKDRIPTYTLGKLHKTRYASLWEDRKIDKD